jgi:hypothetical protein
MDIEKTKLIIRNMELLIDSLKAELYSDSPSYRFDDVVFEEDLDEFFVEENE